MAVQRLGELQSSFSPINTRVGTEKSVPQPHQGITDGTGERQGMISGSVRVGRENGRVPRVAVAEQKNPLWVDIRQLREGVQCRIGVFGAAQGILTTVRIRRIRLLAYAVALPTRRIRIDDQGRESF